MCLVFVSAMALLVPPGKSLDVSWAGAAVFMSKYSGKDKVARIVQYLLMAARVLWKDRPERMAWMNQMFREVMVGRRTFRFFSSVGAIAALRKGIGGEDALARQLGTVSKCGMIGFHLIDHVRWLQDLKLLPGSTIDSKNRSFTCFAVASALTMVVQARVWLGKPPRALSDGKISQVERMAALRKKREAARRSTVRNFLVFFQCLHISTWYTGFGQSAIGISGVISSSMDCCDLWPAAAAVAPSKR